MTTTATHSADDIYKALCSALPPGAVGMMSMSFSLLADNRGRLEFVHDMLEDHGLLPLTASDATAKNAARSEELHKLGEAAESASDALEYFNKSLGFAPPKGEHMAKALIGRSDVLRKLGNLHEALQDLKNALECSNCDKDTITLKISEFEDRARGDDKPSLAIEPELSHKPNQKISCAGDCVALDYASNMGRFVVATKDIKLGDIIAIEEPYVSFVMSQVPIGRCHRCVRLSHSPLPCDSCSYAFYCSPECKQLAWNNYHKYECPIMGTLLDLKLCRLNLIALRIAFAAAPEYNNIPQYPETSEGLYKSGRYQEIHQLCTNTQDRTVADLFKRAAVAAIIYEHVRLHTTFFTDGNDEGTFKELLLKHMQTAPSNFHEISEKLIHLDGDRGNDIVEVGAGAYSFLSMINHACSPNVTRHCYAAKIALSALADIRKGEQLFDNYGYHYATMPRAERQRHVKLQYLFDCTCTACLQDWPLYDDLTVLENQPGITWEHIEILKEQDDEKVRILLVELMEKARALEAFKPCKNLSDVQECIKECYSILSNKRFI